MELSLKLCRAIRFHNIKVLSKGYHNYASKDVTIKHTRFGQPTATTHPHLLKAGEVTPETTADEYRTRRHALMESIADVCVSREDLASAGHIVVIPSARKQFMSGEIPYLFRQNSDFLYLTGVQEPDCVLVLNSLPNIALPTHRSTLFVRPSDDYSEKWEGPRTSPVGATELFKVDEAFTIEELPLYLNRMSQSVDSGSLCVWYDFSDSPHAKIHESVVKGTANNVNGKILSPRNLLHQLRLIKSQSEINLMRRACDIGSEAIKRAMQTSKPGINEHELFARVDFESRIRGALYLAYPPVVAGGSRANTIHYINNDQLVRDGEMVLMDAGCEFGGYSSDITRTWPINLKFSAAQKSLYEAVLRVQEDLIGVCRSSRPTINQLYSKMCLLLGKHLQSVGLVPAHASGSELVDFGREVCPHHVSHYLGMDIHDTDTASKNIPITEGMIITIEPGVYIRENDRSVPAEFRGIGIRIEDDVLITDTGIEVLTEKCPKSVADIEGLKTNP